jgi:phosphatidyl-myo-inositol dimannoside synthase
VTRPCLAAITLDRHGGGVAAVSRLLWETIKDRWGDAGRLLTLLDDALALQSLDSSTPARLRFGARLARLQAMRQCDWIFYSHLSVARVQAFVPAPIRRPYGVFIHGIEAWRRLTPGQTAVLKGAAFRVANSGFTARRVTALHQEIGEILTCPLSLPRGAFNSPRSVTASVEFGPHAVIVVARMAASERYKGHDELLTAWPSVLDRVPDARLIVVGDGDDAPRLKQKAAALGINDHVLFTGFVSDAELQTMYPQAAVFAMPSRGEGFGLVYLEAMLHCLPCIGSVDDAARDVIEDGVTGFLIRQTDCRALADRIIRLLTDEALRRQLGRQGQERLHKEFSYERFSTTMADLMETRLGRPTSGLERTAAL